ncbi:MAG: RsmB/NOP family class I SAM-dependent RNA methyltransferase, partial [Oscillospiraceae bacterium]
MSYFEEREHLLLGTQYDEMYKATANIFRGITLNTLRCSHEKLMNAKMPIEPSAFCDNAYVLQDTEYKIGKHPYYHAGAYYIQEPSAASAAPLLGVEQDDFVLDTCAAHGGKTSQLACALGGTGILIANEYKYDRACVLASNLERMGTVNTVVTCASTDKLALSLPSFFDKILVDAPCSGEGMFRKEPKALSQHSKALVEQCAHLGAEILDNAAVCLAPGGTIL